MTVFTKNRERLLVGEVAQDFFTAVVEQAGLEVGRRMSFEGVAFNRDTDRIRLKIS